MNGLFSWINRVKDSPESTKQALLEQLRKNPETTRRILYTISKKHPKFASDLFHEYQKSKQTADKTVHEDPRPAGNLAVDMLTNR